VRQHPVPESCVAVKDEVIRDAELGKDCPREEQLTLAVALDYRHAKCVEPSFPVCDAVEQSGIRVALHEQDSFREHGFSHLPAKSQLDPKRDLCG
jgi:hypothetical protein